MQVAGSSHDVVDWRCAFCTNQNKAEHRMCTTCQKWRDLDWECAMCGYKNFAKRDTCKSCGIGKVDESVSGEALGTSYSEWSPGNSGGGHVAGYQDTAEASYSQTSYSPASYFPQNSVEPVYPTAGGGIELPWLCGLCKIENSPVKIMCFECSGHRERVEVRNRAAESRMLAMSAQKLAPAPSSSRVSLSHSRQTTLQSVPDLTRVQYKPGGVIEDQSKDWKCGNCSNRNFAKRSKCNKCSKQRHEVEVKLKPLLSWDMSHVREVPVYSDDRPASLSSHQETSLLGTAPEDRTNDWMCSECHNRNFARRTECNKCKLPRAEVEDREVMFDAYHKSRKRSAEPSSYPSKQIRSNNSLEDLSNDWVCGDCNINCFAKKTHCFRCNQPREVVENTDVSAIEFETSLSACSTVSRPIVPQVTNHSLQVYTKSSRTDRASASEERTKRKWVDEDKSNDWNCKFCSINNFAKRKSCFRCNKSRNECEETSDDTINDVE